jgi:hypothetical protein
MIFKKHYLHLLTFLALVIFYIKNKDKHLLLSQVQFINIFMSF